MRNYSRDELKTLIVRSLADFVVPCVTTDNDANNAVGLSARAAILCAATCFLYDQMANPLVEWHSARLNDTIRRLFRELDSFNLVLVKISCAFSPVSPTPSSTTTSSTPSTSSTSSTSAWCA